MGLILALLFLYIRLGFASDASLGAWISGDTLYPVNVFVDILRDGYSLSGWRFSIAPCWFPDLAAAGFFWILTQNPISGTLLAGFIQIGIIVAAFHLIGKAIGIRYLQLQDTLLLGTGIAITLFVALHPSADYPKLYQFFLPQTHVGALINVLSGWGLGLFILRSHIDGIRPSNWSIIAYALVCLLAGLSNVLFFPQMLVPLTGALFFLYFFRLVTLRQCFLPVVYGWLFAFLGAALNRILFRVADVGVQAGVSYDRVLTSLDVFMRGFTAKILALDVLHLGSVAWAAFCIGYVAWLLRHMTMNGRARVLPSQSMMAAFLLASLLSSILSAAAVILGGSNGLAVFKDYVWTMHYLHQIFLFPLFGFPAAIAWLLASSPRDRLRSGLNWTVAGGSLVVVLIYVLPAQWPATPLYAYRTPLVRLIDELAPAKGLQYGYAGYWQARLITLLSQSGVRAYAVDGSMNPFVWANNEDWYHQSLEDRAKRPSIDFVVLDDPLFKIQREAAVRVFGEPVSEARSQGIRVLIYHR